MECMCAQTRPRFILSSERVLGGGVRTHVNSKGKISSTEKSSPEEVQTHDAASSRTAPNHAPTSRINVSEHAANSLSTPRIPKLNVFMPETV